MAEDRPTAKAPLRRLAPYAAAACAALLAAALGGRARARRAGDARDPPERGYAEERMEENATGEGMPERNGG